MAERTPEERARAAAERAARRAAREGRPAPPQEAFTSDPPSAPAEPRGPSPAPPAEAVSSHGDHTAPAPAEAVSNHGDHTGPAPSEAVSNHGDHTGPAPSEAVSNHGDHTGPAPSEAVSNHGDHAGTAPSEPVSNYGDHAGTAPSEPQSTAEWAPEWEPEPELVEVGATVGEPTRPRRRGSAAAGPLPRPAARTARRHSPAKPARRPTGAGGRWRRRFAVVIAMALLGGALWFINSTFQPFHGAGSGGVAVVVPKGADAGQIGDILEHAGVIDSSFFFQVNATVTMRRGDLIDGRYLLRKGMTNGQAIDALMQGPKARVVKTYDVTIPEGLSRREAAAVVHTGGVQGDYLKASNRRAARREARKLGMPKGTKSTEGFLFPATYTLTAGATPNTLVDKQLAAFKDNFAKLDLRYAKRRNLTRYDLLIIASMVEREASLDRERPLIAAVIYNRLKRGIPLGIDATIRYRENNWTRPLRVSELERDGPYNTRLRRGLPPTPIGNPGLASLEAAAHPSSKGYLFYVRKPGKSGEHAFSSSDAQFERDVKRYQASRENK
jgi:UPF0755 protein